MRKLGVALLIVGTLGFAVVSACAEKKGALILAVDTDMKAPKDVNAVSVTISTNGAIKHSFIGRVTPQGEVLLPATLAIVEPEDKSASIRIRVMAFQNQKPRVLRDVRTTIPASGRTALLRIPLNFVSDGSAVGPSLPNGILPAPIPGTGGTTGGTSGGTTGDTSGVTGSGAADFDFFGTFQPPCPDIQNQTIIDGACADNFVDPATLPDFVEGMLGNSTDLGTCFDVAKCFAGAAVVGNGSDGPSPSPINDAGTNASDASASDRDAAPPGDAGMGFKTFRPSAIVLDRTTCELQLNGANAARLNLALVTPDTGECVRPGECYVPIDRGGSGWKDEGGRVKLPAFVCKLLGSKNLRLATSSEICTAKSESNPLCTPAVPGPVGSSGMPGGNPFSRCGSNNSMSSCSEAEIKPYNDCLAARCDSLYSPCFGPGWKTGSFSGPCGPFLDCFAACPCNDQSCFMSCGQPSSECQACVESTGSCSEGCTQPPCAMTGPPDAGPAADRTCEELGACCAKIGDQSAKTGCTQSLAAAAGNDATCSAYYQAFSAYCP